LRLFGIDLDATKFPARYATFAAIVFFLLALVVAKVRRGALGRRLMAVRGSERAAASLGINVYAAKLFAFSLGAGIAAIGGMVVAFRSPSLVYSTSYGYDTSINALIYTVIGGLGFVVGPVVATPRSCRARWPTNYWTSCDTAATRCLPSSAVSGSSSCCGVHRTAWPSR